MDKTKKLADVLTINEDGEIRPRIDIREVFAPIFETRFWSKLSYLEYERACEKLGRKPSLNEWAGSQFEQSDEGPGVA